MKVHVNYTLVVTEPILRGINIYHGKPGLATRMDVKDWYYLHGRSMDDDLMHLYDLECGNESDSDG